MCLQKDLYKMTSPVPFQKGDGGLPSDFYLTVVRLSIHFFRVFNQIVCIRDLLVSSH